MKNSIRFLGIIALAAVISCSITACEHETHEGDFTPQTSTPLTGTVTVTSNVTLSIVYGGQEEKMKLTTDVSGLNGTSSVLYSYQWIKDDAYISGATSSTYDVTEADYGKTVRVKVTYSGYSGEQFGDFAVPNPTKLTLTLKRHTSNWGTQDTGITIERVDGSIWKTASTGTGTYGNLNTTGTTVTLTSWTQTNFKMRTTYQFIENKFYFKKDNASGSELFELTNGTKTYVLENSYSSPNFTDLFAKEAT